jgi:hypothetical protein
MRRLRGCVLTAAVLVCGGCGRGWQETRHAAPAGDPPPSPVSTRLALDPFPGCRLFSLFPPERLPERRHVECTEDVWVNVTGAYQNGIERALPTAHRQVWRAVTALVTRVERREAVTGQRRVSSHEYRLYLALPASKAAEPVPTLGLLPGVATCQATENWLGGEADVVVVSSDEKVLAHAGFRNLCSPS